VVVEEEDMGYSDIKPKWFNLVRRLQGLARQQNGVALLSVSVLVDSEGNPLLWETPHRADLEPCFDAEQAIHKLLSKTRGG
jgi:hypothetical protein